MIREGYLADWPMLLDGPVVSVRGAFHPNAEGEGSAHAYVALANGALFKFYYWRLIVGGESAVTSFDHLSRLGGPPIDAIAQLTAALEGQHCLRAELDLTRGDIALLLGNGTRLEALRIRTLFEDWEVEGPDSSLYWSNMIWKRP
ncbi:type 1 periplasmic-binding domain-containing protein [Devosia rhizoryzae]|uniref:Uncharacterized protein n=1 Tax=Devosia rhizoryzae TaxID=2774137 RepID=A0ABX7C9C1_9HYPH|nr:hypothetical protein [Devosia rhizoryzae]QQR40393.1 hypothetical protein JI748_05145 [Devosia rhizoryzae]